MSARIILAWVLLLVSPVVRAATDTAQFNFESGTQGWTSTGAAIQSVSATTLRSWAGSGSLAVGLNSAGAVAQQQVTVANPGVPKRSTVTFHVFLPAGAPIASLRAFAEDDKRNGTFDQAASPFALGAWNTLNVTLPVKA